nr:hypothetical protein [Pandoravirus massiliensis]
MPLVGVCARYVNNSMQHIKKEKWPTGQNPHTAQDRSRPELCDIADAFLAPRRLLLQTGRKKEVKNREKQRNREMTTTAVFKRPFDVHVGRRRHAKRLRTDSAIKCPLPTIDALDDGIVRDGNDDDDDNRDSEATGRLVRAASAPSDSILAKVLGETSPEQVASALLSLFGDATAFDRLCRCVAAWPLRDTIPFARVLCGAALGRHTGAIGALVSVPCSVDDISEALMLCMRCGDDGDDPRAVAAIVEACETEPRVTVAAYREIVRYALRDAVQLRRPRAVAYLADVAETSDLETHLWACALDRDDPRASLFAALWRPLDLCAHAYAAVLPPCPALDYLTAIAAAGVPCSRSCSERLRDGRDAPARRERHSRQ